MRRGHPLFLRGHPQYCFSEIVSMLLRRFFFGCLQLWLCLSFCSKGLYRPCRSQIDLSILSLLRRYI